MNLKTVFAKMDSDVHLIEELVSWLTTQGGSEAVLGSAIVKVSSQYNQFS